MKVSVFISMMFMSWALSASPEINITQQKKLGTDELSIELNARNNADIWGITKEEWLSFEKLMKGEAKYHWSHLDPVFVLGLNAESSFERTRFAEIYAKQEYNRTAQLLAFNNEYVAQMERLYGGESLIDKRKILPKSKSKDKFSSMHFRDTTFGDKLILFMKKDCVRCDDIYRRLKHVTMIGVSRNLYFVGEYKDEDIVMWGKRMDISPDVVRGGMITLNHDRGEYAAYGSPTIPNAFILRGSQAYKLEF